MQLIRTKKALRRFVAAQRKKEKTIGFVPTMGALHAGHLSLVRRAKNDCDICTMSIFVNPMQFGSRDDYQKYPRDIRRDKRLAQESRVDAIFYPSIKEMYAVDCLTHVDVGKITERLCGRFRPGHFRGVATVVAKLFNIVEPDVAYFGQKDAQQVAVIRRMVADLDIPVVIKVAPVVREPNGLAMSSRNAYLSPLQRRDAAVLFQSLKKAQALIKKGERSSRRIVAAMRRTIIKKNPSKIDYIECVDPVSLSSVSRIKGRVLIALAVWFGRTRLIDNIVVSV